MMHRIDIHPSVSAQVGGAHAFGVTAQAICSNNLLAPLANQLPHMEQEHAPFDEEVDCIIRERGGGP